MKTAKSVAGVVISLLLAVMQLQSAAEGDLPPDPEMLQYLDILYNNVNTLQRPLVNGELNLLPDHTDGFANSIRCFTDTSATSVTNNSRTLHFNLSDSLDPIIKIIAVDLVLKEARGSSSYSTHLHEISGNATDMNLRLLDSGEYTGNWHTLHVQNLVDSVDGASGKRNYELLLSMDGGEAAEDILRVAKPMLLIYTDDMGQIIEGEYGTADFGTAPVGREASRSRSRSRTKESRQESGQSRSSQGRRRRRRDVSDEASSDSSSPILGVSELKKLPCQKHTRVISFSDLGWPGPRFSVITPGPSTSFSFCTGTCTDPLSSSGPTNYTNHAKLISLTQPSLSGMTPCCVATEYTHTSIVYRSRFSRVVTMTSFPVLASCGCS